MTSNASPVRQLFVAVTALLLLLVVATPAAGARSLEAQSAACELPHHWATSRKDAKHTIDHYGERLGLVRKCSPVSDRWRPSTAPMAPQLMAVSIMAPGYPQPGVCESPFRSRLFHDEVHVGLGCDDRTWDQPTALDGFARMRYHIAVPK